MRGFHVVRRPIPVSRTADAIVRAAKRGQLGTATTSPRFQQGAFVAAGVRMLDGVKVFWDGLDESPGLSTRVSADAASERAQADAGGTDAAVAGATPLLGA